MLLINVLTMVHRNTATGSTPEKSNIIANYHKNIGEHCVSPVSCRIRAKSNIKLYHSLPPSFPPHSNTHTEANPLAHTHTHTQRQTPSHTHRGKPPHTHTEANPLTHTHRGKPPNTHTHTYRAANPLTHPSPPSKPMYCSLLVSGKTKIKWGRMCLNIS